VTRVTVVLLLSLGIFVGTVAQNFSTDNATVIFATAASASTPLLEEAIYDGDENLPASGPSYLQPTIFRPALFTPTAKQSVVQTASFAKKDLKLYRLNGVLLI
jgi:Na+(H+)/acetate symporter ActP